MSRTVGRHRKNRTLSYGTVAVVAAGAAGVYLTAVPFGAGAATMAVVVSTSGNDSNAGTLDAPYRTLQKAFAVASAGTTISVRGGTYYPTATLKSSVSGTTANRITLQAYGTEAVKVDGSYLTAGSWLVGLHANFWTVQDIQFQSSPAQGFVCTSCTGGIFKNLTTHGNGDSGFMLRGDNSNHNLIQNLDSYDNYDSLTHGENADGIAIKFGSGTGNKVTGARLYNNSDDGLDLWSWLSPVTIENTWSFGNGKNRWNDPAFEGNGNGFKLGGGGSPAAHVVNNNAAWDNNLHGFTENSNTGAISLNRNTAYRNTDTGFSFANGTARLGENLAVSNGRGLVTKSGSVLSAGNNWDSGIATPTFLSTTASTVYNTRQSGGALPATTFLMTGSTTVGATMD